MAARKKKSAPKWDGDSACLAMHTALRKACDSAPTTALWNMIHLCESPTGQLTPWAFYGQRVAELLNAGEPPARAVRFAEHGRWTDAYLDEMLKMRRASPQPGTALESNLRHWLYAISGVLRCFESHDWDGMGAYLAEVES